MALKLIVFKNQLSINIVIQQPLLLSLCSELLSRSQQDRLSSAANSIVKRTLQWVLLLEEWRPVVLHKVSSTAKIARLMCTFLTGVPSYVIIFPPASWNQ